MVSLAISKGESVEALAARLFNLSDAAPQAKKQAADALRKANPQLANPGDAPAGSVVVVPELPQATNTNATLKPTTLAPADSARLVGEQATAFASALAIQSNDAAAQANATLQLLQDPALMAAAAKDSTLAQRLNAISDSTNAALKDMQANQAMVLQGLAQLQEDLAAFLKPSPVLTPAPKPPTPAPPVTTTPPSPPPHLRGQRHRSQHRRQSPKSTSQAEPSTRPHKPPKKKK
jgi:hypothetical protein